MASIEYGIDRRSGKKVYAKEAVSGIYYICPYCSDLINVRKTKPNVEDFFVHKREVNRTPEKMICPGYTGNNKKIERINDKVYISNGGLPLYLLKIDESKYKLEARFPPLTYKTSKLIEKWNLRVIINEGNNRPIEYSAINIRPYPIKSTEKWINIEFRNMQSNLNELKEKWGWGIRGISMDSDFFHSNNYGGFRLSQHSNIVLGKEYLYISEWNKFDNVKGITFNRKGEITLSRRSYNVNSIVVNEITDESIAFIHTKGYQLIDKNDEIIPIWPPAVIEGKEIIYQENDEEAYFYKDEISNQQVFSITKNGLIDVDSDKKILKTYTLDNIILSSDYQFNLLSNEIRYTLTRNRKKFLDKQPIKADVTYKTLNTNKKNFSDFDINKYKNKDLFIYSNLPMDILIGKDNYIDYSSKQYIESNKKYNKIIVSLFAIGYIEHNKSKNELLTINDKKLEILMKKLYRCKSQLVPFNKEYLKVLNYMKSKNIEIYKILLKWSLSGKMPYAAVKYIDNIIGVINNEE